LRLPSVKYLFDEAYDSLRRFPLVLTAALVAAVTAIVANDVDEKAPFVRALVSAQLGIPLFFALAVAAESNGWRRPFRAAWPLVAVAALIAYYFTLPDHMHPGAITRFVQFNVGLHLLAAVLPFAHGGRHNGFWQYNRALFLRFLTAVLYSGVVYLGLVLALLALDRLLGLPVSDMSYFRLLMIILFVFNTWVFLGGVPRDIAGLDAVTDYPRALKVFAQYILIPLVVIYLSILTIYLVKIVVTTEWPSGWIGWMVSGVAVVGILALLLVWPVANRDENKWVATYTQSFFIFMFPAIVMLLLAIYKRIDQYGITENRYFLAVLSVWLAAVAVYFVVSRGRRIKVIPLTLCAVAFATSFGPWGAYTASRNSQMTRLVRLMESNDILADGAIAKTTTTVSFEDRREISAITLYLVEHHGQKTFDRWLDTKAIEPADSTAEHSHDRNTARSIVSAMGLEYVDSWARVPGSEGNFNYSIEQRGQLFALEGADYMVRIITKTDQRAIGATGFVVAWRDSAGVVLTDSLGTVAVAPVDSVLARIDGDSQWSERAIPADLMRVSVEADRARLTVYFTVLNGVMGDGKATVNYVNADCFVTLR